MPCGLPVGTALMRLVISRFLPIQNYYNFAGPKEIVRYNGEFVISGFLLSAFHCIIDEKQQIIFTLKIYLSDYQTRQRSVESRQISIRSTNSELRYSRFLCLALQKNLYKW